MKEAIVVGGGGKLTGVNTIKGSIVVEGVWQELALVRLGTVGHNAGDQNKGKTAGF